jgi:hypothetical protein
MPRFTDLGQETILKLLRYDEATGKLFWLPRGRGWFSHDASYSSFVTRFANKEALTADNGEGYRTGTLLTYRVKAHQVIWYMLHGKLPDEGFEIDHINGNKSDNRLINLRCVKKEDNAKNLRRSHRNQTGVLGVSLYKPSGKWLARINADKKTKCLGYFESFEDACKARLEAELENNYHKNHGKR